MSVCKNFKKNMEELINFDEEFSQSVFADSNLIIEPGNAIPLAKQFIQFRNKYRLLKDGFEKFTVFVEDLDEKIFQPMVKRRQTLAEAVRRKGYKIDDGIKVNEFTKRVYFDKERHQKYWSEFWGQYGIEYKLSGRFDQEQVEKLLSGGMDFFVGIPQISNDKWREIFDLENLKYWSPDKLDQVIPSRQRLTKSSYPLAIKISKEIARFEKSGDQQLKKNKINFYKAHDIAVKETLRGLTYKEYLIIQLWYNKLTGQHLDEYSKTWLLDQESSNTNAAFIAQYASGSVVMSIRSTNDTSDLINDDLGVRLCDILKLKK